MAEMENQRRRFEKERQEAFEFGGFNFARESLSLLDNIDRATASFKNDENLKNNKDLDKIIEGIEVVKKDLISIFKKNGIELIECMNKKFDPNFHQAMLELEDNTKESGTVVQEIQKGYMMKDRLLRPSLVGVTKKRVENSEKATTDGVVLAPSAFSNTLACVPSITATHEFVVPKSIPITLLINMFLSPLYGVYFVFYKQK